MTACWLALYLPLLSTDRLKRARQAPEGARPLVLYAKQANAFQLTAVDAHASELGLRLAMSLADARAIRPDLAALEAEPEEDLRALDAIAAWCERFTPFVALDAPEGLFLDITGCAHLFGGETALRDQIVARLHAQGFHARAALASTPGAAWALARHGKENAGSAQSLALLPPLPVEALRLDPEAAALMRRLGLKTIGQLMQAPRSAFAARAGVAALLRLDQALGRAAEALEPRRPAPMLFALRRFLEPLFSTDAIIEVLRALCADATEKLDRRGAGLRRAELVLFGVDGRDRIISVGVSRPERDAKALIRLFQEKLNAIGENLNAEFGIEAARLDIVELARTHATPRTLVGAEEAAASAEKISEIIDLLSARLGPKRILKPKLHDAHAPERASGWKSALNEPEQARESGTLEFRSDDVLRRPIRLFSPAQPIEAVAAVPDGPPLRFRWRRVLREVARAEGPERIAGDWLTREATRDYYRVEDAQGRRYWLYREGLYGEDAPRWFLHGLFA